MQSCKILQEQVDTVTCQSCLRWYRRCKVCVDFQRIPSWVCRSSWNLNDWDSGFKNSHGHLIPFWWFSDHRYAWFASTNLLLMLLGLPTKICFELFVANAVVLEGMSKTMPLPVIKSWNRFVAAFWHEGLLYVPGTRTTDGSTVFKGLSSFLQLSIGACAILCLCAHLPCPSPLKCQPLQAAFPPARPQRCPQGPLAALRKAFLCVDMIRFWLEIRCD